MRFVSSSIERVAAVAVPSINPVWTIEGDSPFQISSLPKSINDNDTNLLESLLARDPILPLSDHNGRHFSLLVIVTRARGGCTVRIVSLETTRLSVAAKIRKEKDHQAG